MKQNITPKYVRSKEAAAHIGLRYHTFRHAVAKGWIPFYKLGASKLFKVDELEQALVAHRVSSTAEVLS